MARKRQRQKPEITAEREKQVWSLRLRNYTQQEIADDLKIAQTTVSKILKRMTVRYHNNNLRNIKRVKREQVAQLEYAAREMFDAWEKSKNQTEKILSSEGVARTKEEIDRGEQPKPNKVTSIIKQSPGEVKYLEAYRKFKEDIRKIMGVDAPVKIENEHMFGDAQFTLVIPNANKLAAEKEAESSENGK